MSRATVGAMTDLQRIHDRELEQSRRTALYSLGLGLVIAIVIAAVGLATIIVARVVG